MTKKYFVSGLTKAQRAAFEQIAIGNDSFVNRKIALKLIEKGLIKECNIIDGIFTIYRYQVPIATHAQWCEWCSK